MYFLNYGSNFFTKKAIGCPTHTHSSAPDGPWVKKISIDSLQTSIALTDLRSIFLRQENLRKYFLYIYTSLLYTLISVYLVLTLKENSLKHFNSIKDPMISKFKGVLCCFIWTSFEDTFWSFVSFILFTRISGRKNVYVKN